MKISLKEEVYNILLNSKEPMSSQHIKDKLTVHINTKRHAIDQCILKLSNLDGCDITEITLECAYYQLTSTANYSSFVVLTGPELVIKIMTGANHMFIDELYKQAVKMGYKTDRRRFRAKVYAVSQYNGCVMDSYVDDESGKHKYKMVKAPVRPYTPGNKAKKPAKETKVVELIEDEPHCRSAVKLLFEGMCKDAATQNRKMINDWKW